MVPSSSLGPTPVALGTRECCPSQAQRKLPPPNVTRFEAGPRCRIPELPVKQSDFSSVPVPPCSSSDVSAVTAPHGESQGGVFKLPKPAPTAWWIRDFPGWEELLEKKKARRKHSFSPPPKKTPNQEETQVFSPKILQGGGESSQDVSEWLQSSKRQKPTRHSPAFWHGGNKPKSCCWRSVAASQQGTALSRTCRHHLTPSRSSEIPGIRQVQGKSGPRR